MKAHLALAVSAVALAACGSPAAAPAPAANVPPPPAASPASAPAAAAPQPAAPVASTPSPAQPGGDGPLGASPATVAAAAAAAVSGPVIPKYDAQGRRDPFEALSIRAGSDNSTIATAKLTGIIRSNGGPLALVETADGIGYILRPGDTLADGRLVEVGINSAMFSLAPKAGAATNRVVLKLAGD